MATLSGVAATINITRNRFILVQTAQQGGYVATPQAVSSGVVLTITPTAMNDGTIRMVVNISDSQFVPTTQNVAVETDQNQANTTMQVADGESIVIGGLVLDRRTDSNAGWPGLRNVPVLTSCLPIRLPSDRNRK